MRTELFESIHIKNFRSIDDCQLNELSKINFLLGENSVGKTSILEAIIMHANKFNIASILRTLSVSRYVQRKECNQNISELFNSKRKENIEVVTVLGEDEIITTFEPDLLEKSKDKLEVNNEVNQEEEPIKQNKFIVPDVLDCLSEFSSDNYYLVIKSMQRTFSEIKNISVKKQIMGHLKSLILLITLS